MTPMRFLALPTELARAYQAGASDANGQVPERKISDGQGNPCRHCLREIPAGKPMLVLAHRPFSVPQPYAESGPIFLCADQCTRHPESESLPEMFEDYGRLLIRGYGENERILYGTGQVVEIAELAEKTAELLENPAVAFVHYRSASNNCFQCRVERG